MIKCHVIGKISDGGGYWYKIPTNNNKAQQSRAPILWYVVYTHTCRLVFINDRNTETHGLVLHRNICGNYVTQVALNLLMFIGS